MGKAKYGERNFREKLWLYTAEQIMEGPIPRTMSINGVDYICITDIAKQKNGIDPNGVVANWMRNRNTIEYLGLWETLQEHEYWS